MRLLREIWNFSKFRVAQELPRLRPSLRFVVQLFFFALLLLIWPLFPILSSPCERLFQRAAALRETSPEESLALLHGVFEQLIAAERAGRLSSPVARLEIPPFGRFSWMAAVEVGALLYHQEIARADYEAAADVMAVLPPAVTTISFRVDALLKGGHQVDAIRLLEGNLHRDDRRGTLRKRLASLTGGDRSSLN